jgi:hypothetical protein
VYGGVGCGSVRHGVEVFTLQNRIISAPTCGHFQAFQAFQAFHRPSELVRETMKHHGIMTEVICVSPSYGMAALPATYAAGCYKVPSDSRSNVGSLWFGSKKCASARNALKWSNKNTCSQSTVLTAAQRHTGTIPSVRSSAEYRTCTPYGVQYSVPTSVQYCTVLRADATPPFP